MILCARCWWSTRTTFISNACSTRFKTFNPLINLSLTYGALSILSQHTTVNFHRFHSFCTKNPHYATLFFDGAILQMNPRCFHSTEGFCNVGVVLQHNTHITEPPPPQPRLLIVVITKTTDDEISPSFHNRINLTNTNTLSNENLMMAAIDRNM